MTTIFDDSSKEMACRELLKNGIHQAHVKYMANDLFVTFCLKRCFSLPFNLHSPIHQYLIDEIYNAIRGEPSNSRSITFSMAHGRTNSEKVQFIYSTLIKLFTINKVAPSTLDWIIQSNNRQIKCIHLILNFLHLNLTQQQAMMGDVINDGELYLYPNQSPLLEETIYGASTQTSDTKKSCEIIKIFFNCSQGSRESKTAIINLLKELWIRTEKINKYQQWRSKNKSDDLNAWLIEQDIFGVAPQIQYLVQRHNSSKLDKIELFFDAFYFLFPDTAELKLQKLKKSWSQNKTRGKNSNKKQSNFILSTSTKKLLEETCNTEGCSMSDLVNAAIQKECERINERNKANNK
ncbi:MULTISPECIES: hypothetical protein [Aeromonas]|uniref:hypothetical protein n=1 Tax=Aeromonas TaxID=642 RepID=UPI0023AAEB49|nr:MULTISPECIES: hypothetical protein [Aeromonas]MEB5666465.1 hypothetical protein [Aeromonas veronii]WEE23012.1 hypothetical protein PY772_05930 [Aeromonas caviae]